MVIGTVEIRKYKSSRNNFSCMSFCKSRFVATTIRTSTSTDCVPPTRSNRRSSSTRNSLAWIASGSSPISSRNSVPRCARSIFPTLRAPAPVKAPFSCPKSSFSTKPSGIAAQFRATKGCSRRGDKWWIARAKSSLPVPLSPSSKAVESVGARHLEIGHHQQMAARANFLDGGSAVGSLLDGIACTLQRLAQHGAQLVLVFHKEQRFHVLLFYHESKARLVGTRHRVRRREVA